MEKMEEGVLSQGACLRWEMEGIEGEQEWQQERLDGGRLTLEKGLLMVNAQIRSLGCALHMTMRLLSATIQKEPIAVDREESPKEGLGSRE